MNLQGYHQYERQRHSVNKPNSLFKEGDHNLKAPFESMFTEADADLMQVKVFGQKTPIHFQTESSMTPKMKQK